MGKWSSAPRGRGSWMMLWRRRDSWDVSRHKVQGPLSAGNRAVPEKRAARSTKSCLCLGPGEGTGLGDAAIRNQADRSPPSLTTHFDLGRTSWPCPGQRWMPRFTEARRARRDGQRLRGICPALARVWILRRPKVTKTLLRQILMHESGGRSIQWASPSPGPDHVSSVFWVVLGRTTRHGIFEPRPRHE